MSQSFVSTSTLERFASSTINSGRRIALRSCSIRVQPETRLAYVEMKKQINLEYQNELLAQTKPVPPGIDG